MFSLKLLTVSNKHVSLWLPQLSLSSLYRASLIRNKTSGSFFSLVILTFASSTSSRHKMPAGIFKMSDANKTQMYDKY